MDMTQLSAGGFTGFDWVVVALVGLLALAGIFRGFTQEALSLAGWIAAIIVVRLFHQDVTMWLAPRVGGEASGAIIAFLLLFFGTVMAGRLIAGAAGGLAKRSVLGPMDRLLGFGFGGLKGVILASGLFLLAQFSTGLFDPDETPPDWLIQSRSAPLLGLSANAMVGWVQELQDDKAGEGFGLPPGMAIPPGALPPGHPSIEEPFGGPQGAAPDAEGYSAEDRDALDRLLDEGAKKGDQVQI
ncbi:MAG: CvpA family protein [Sandaracinobacteroides sp.]